MKVQITVEIGESDGKFFDALMTGSFDWARSASLTIENGAASLEPVDATWLLRADVAMLSTDKL